MMLQPDEPLAVNVVDELLCCLADARNLPLAMRAGGHTLQEISGRCTTPGRRAMSKRRNPAMNG